MFMLTFIFDSVWFFFCFSKGDSLQFFLLLMYIYICIFVEDPIIKRESVCSPLSGLDPPHFLHVPNQDLDVESHNCMSSYFFCVQLFFYMPFKAAFSLSL